MEARGGKGQGLMTIGLISVGKIEIKNKTNMTVNDILRVINN